MLRLDKVQSQEGNSYETEPYLVLFLLIPKGHALEQGDDSEGVGGLHPQAAEGTAAYQGAGEQAEEAGTCQQAPAAQNTGLLRNELQILLVLQRVMTNSGDLWGVG